MDATIESDTSQNTNSSKSSGYLIKNYSDDDKQMDAILESSEDKVKTFAQRTNGLTVAPFSPQTNSLPLSLPLTTEISFLSIALFSIIVKQFVSCNGLAYILCSTSCVYSSVLVLHDLMSSVETVISS